MRFYVTWAFQRTPPLGSHITSDNTGILSWLNWEEGPSPYSGRLSFRTFCLTSSRNTKENLVMTWLGFFSFHIAGSPRGMGWYHWQGLDMGREFEAEHTEVRSVRKPAARWLGASIPSTCSSKPTQRALSQYLHTAFRETIFQALGGILVVVGHYDAICHTSKRPKVKCLQELQKQSQLNPVQESSSAYSSELAYMLSVLLSWQF